MFGAHMSAVLDSQQFQLPFPEHSLYLTGVRPDTHFAVLWRDPARRARSVEAMKAAGLLQCHIDYLLKLNPERADVDGLREQLAKVKRDFYDKRQECFPLSSMATVIPLLPRDRDTWISQSTFNTTKSGFMSRRKVHFSACSVLFADLDFYKAGYYTDPDHALQHALQIIEDAGWPAPSIAVFSGRGIYLKWLFTTPLPRPALPRWEAAERQIIKLLKSAPELGVDESVKDISRVLRLENTLNEKSGQAVRVLWVNEGGNGKPKQYDFEYLFEYMLPYTKAEVLAFRSRDQLREEANIAFRREWQEKGKAAREKKAKKDTSDKATRLRPLPDSVLAWDRVMDLETLAKLRGWDRNEGGSGVSHGYRSHFVLYHVNFSALAGDFQLEEFWAEVVATIDRFAPDLLKTHRKDVFNTLFMKMRKFVRNEMVTDDVGGIYPALYTPKNQTLIDLFNITPDEERQLKTIVSEGEARRRDAERARTKRQAAGGKTREEYLACGTQKRTSAQLMRAQGKSWKEIAETLGYSNADAARKSCALKQGEAIDATEGVSELHSGKPEKVRPYC